jgi:phytoene synthase
MADSFDHCEQLVRVGDKDRFLATLFAPPKCRRALYVLYAFNLEIARTRELAREPMPGEIRLQWWRDVLGGVGRAEVDANPVAHAFRDVVVRYRLPPATVLELIDARTFDLYNEPMPSMASLTNYARATSSLLIDLADRILCDGREPTVGTPVDHAGIAYSIAGILRALPIHAARGQQYLPSEIMDRCAAKPSDLFAGRQTRELRAVLAELRGAVRNHLESARALLDTMPVTSAPALLPVALVRPAINRMERRGYQPFGSNDLPQWRRQWSLWSAARTNLRSAF